MWSCCATTVVGRRTFKENLKSSNRSIYLRNATIPIPETSITKKRGNGSSGYKMANWHNYTQYYLQSCTHYFVVTYIALGLFNILLITLLPFGVHLRQRTNASSVPVTNTHGACHTIPRASAFRPGSSDSAAIDSQYNHSCFQFSCSNARVLHLTTCRVQNLVPSVPGLRQHLCNLHLTTRLRQFFSLNNSTPSVFNIEVLPYKMTPNSRACAIFNIQKCRCLYSSISYQF